MGGEENLEIVRRFFQGFAEGELSLEMLAPDVTMRNLAEFPIKGPYEGHDGIRQWWADLHRIENGLIVEVTGYASRRQALEAIDA